MGAFTLIGKNTVLDSGLPDVVYAALHSGNPGADGSANEVAGGDPAYARQLVTLAAAANASRNMVAAVTFDVPPGTVAYVSYWTAQTGGVCLATDDVTAEVFAAQGQYRLNASTLRLTA